MVVSFFNSIPPLLLQLLTISAYQLTVSPGLARARRPFRVQNLLVGGAILGFTFFVYGWSIRAVKQDDFSDIESPSEAAKLTIKTIEEEEKDRLIAKNAMKASLVEGLGLEKSALVEKTKDAFKGM